MSFRSSVSSAADPCLRSLNSSVRRTSSPAAGGKPHSLSPQVLSVGLDRPMTALLQGSAILHRRRISVRRSYQPSGEAL